MNKNEKSSKSGFNGLKFDGKQMVYRRPITRKDFHRQFTVAENNKIAEIDEIMLMNSWNSFTRQPWGKRITNYLKHGLLAQTFPIIALYLFCFYLFYLVKASICDSECANNVNKRNETQSDSKINGFVKFFFFIVQNKATNQSNFCDFLSPSPLEPIPPTPSNFCRRSTRFVFQWDLSYLSKEELMKKKFSSTLKTDC